MESEAREGTHSRARAAGGWWRDSLLVAAGALAVYVATLAPTISSGDSPELTTAAWMLGVPHPTGYPLYVLLGHTFIKLFPLGSVAYRMNLLSALLMALALVLLYRIARHVSGRRLPSLAATLLLAFTPGLWSQALIAEVYALHVLLSSAVLVAGIAWDRTGARRWLALTAFLYGLAFTNHMLSALLAPGLVYLGVTSRHRGRLPRLLPALALCFLAPLALYLYLPWAALRDPALNWGDVRSWDNFVAHVTGRQYRDLMFTVPPSRLIVRLKGYPAYLSGQFGYAAVALGLLGAWRLAAARRRWFWGTGLLYGASLAYALNYRIYDFEIYYLPANCVFALWVAVGIAWVLTAGRVVLARRVRPVPARALAGRAAWGLCALLPAMMLAGHWERVSQRDTWWPLEYGRGYLAALAPNAVLFGGGDDLYFPLLYAHHVEGRRPDVTLASYYDALIPGRGRLFERLEARGLRARPPVCGARHWPGTLHACYFRALLAENVDRRPLYLVGPASSLGQPWMRETLAPYARVQATNLPGWRLYRTAPPLQAGGRPEHETRVSFAGIARLVGYDARPFRREGVAMLRMRYFWELPKPTPEAGLKVWVLFTDERGNFPLHPSGEARFHNTHQLGQGRPLPRSGFPRRICETFDVVVPPDEVDQPRRLRVALSSGGTFLPPIGSSGERFADAGSIGTHALAAGSPAGVPRDTPWIIETALPAEPRREPRPL